MVERLHPADQTHGIGGVQIIRLVLLQDGFGHGFPAVDVFRMKFFDATKVQEGHTAILMEQVIARVGITVEIAVAKNGIHGVNKNIQACLVFQLLWSGFTEILKILPCAEFSG